jgi:DNA-binding phage protein
MELILKLKEIVEAYPNKSELCRRSGVSWRSLHRIFTVDGNPRLNTLQKLVDALNLEVIFSQKPPDAQNR